MGYQFSHFNKIGLPYGLVLPLLRDAKDFAIPVTRCGLPSDGKVSVATLLRQRTTVGNSWIAQRLGMGHPGSVSRLVVEAAKDPARIRKLGKPGKMLKRDT